MFEPSVFSLVVSPDLTRKHRLETPKSGGSLVAEGSFLGYFQVSPSISQLRKSTSRTGFVSSCIAADHQRGRYGIQKVKGSNPFSSTTCRTRISRFAFFCFHPFDRSLTAARLKCFLCCKIRKPTPEKHSRSIGFHIPCRFLCRAWTTDPQ